MVGRGTESWLKKSSRAQMVTELLDSRIDPD